MVRSWQKALAERKLVWVKFSDAQEELQQNKDRERDGKKLLKKKVDEFDTAQAPRRWGLSPLCSMVYSAHTSRCWPILGCFQSPKCPASYIECRTPCGEYLLSCMIELGRLG